jgi:hypothetical protein
MMRWILVDFVVRCRFQGKTAVVVEMIDLFFRGVGIELGNSPYFRSIMAGVAPGGNTGRQINKLKAFLSCND